MFPQPQDESLRDQQMRRNEFGEFNFTSDCNGNKCLLRGRRKIQSGSILVKFKIQQFSSYL